MGTNRLPDVKKALSAAVSALYFDDNSDYETALWEVVEALGGQDACDLLENDRQEAYKRYCEDGDDDDTNPPDTGKGSIYVDLEGLR